MWESLQLLEASLSGRLTRSEWPWHLWPLPHHRHWWCNAAPASHIVVGLQLPCSPLVFTTASAGGNVCFWKWTELRAFLLCSRDGGLRVKKNVCSLQSMPLPLEGEIFPIMEPLLKFNGIYLSDKSTLLSMFRKKAKIPLRD